MAVIVWVPLPLLVGMNLTLHDPAVSVHWPLDGVKVPDPEEVNVTVPVGVPPVLLTVAVQVV